MLQRYQSLDVRRLLEQDVLLLRDLCLPSASIIPRHGGDAAADSETSSTAAGVVARCWRLHVGLLMHILQRIPQAANDSLAVVEHVALPCLETLAAVCLDGVLYPVFEPPVEAGSGARSVEGGGSDDQSSIGLTVAETRTSSAAGTNPRRQQHTPNGRVLADVVLQQVLRASANAWGADEGELGGFTVGRRGGGVVWRTPMQTRNAKLARRAWQGLVSGSTGTAGGAAAVCSGSAGGELPTSAMANESAVSCLPDHWLLKLLVNRRSAVLRKFSSLVLGTLATSMGAEFGEETAEVAAHLLGCVAAEGSEAAALQVSFSFVCLFLRYDAACCTRTH